MSLCASLTSTLNPNLRPGCLASCRRTRLTSGAAGERSWSLTRMFWLSPVEQHLDFQVTCVPANALHWRPQSSTTSLLPYRALASSSVNRIA